MEREPNNKSRREYRSSFSKPFYKRWWVWLVIILVVTIGVRGIYNIGEKDQTVDESLDQEKEEKTNKNDQDIIKDKEAEATNSEQEDTPEESNYEDFKGTYVEFEGEPYNSSILSDIIVLGDAHYKTFDRWEFNMTSTILDKKIEGNTLTIELDSDENEMWGLHSETGTEQFTLDDKGDTKALHYEGSEDITYYSMTNKDLEEHYSQSEIDYARIIMTLRGVPSVDSWEAYSAEYEGDKPIIGISYDTEGDSIPYIDDDVEVGYPEDVTTLYLQNKTRQDEISYTYASIENGYIRVYPVPINHAIRTGEEVINDAEKKEIKPFEPYEVADFIGNVEFVYE